LIAHYSDFYHLLHDRISGLIDVDSTKIAVCDVMVPIVTKTQIVKADATTPLHNVKTFAQIGQLPNMFAMCVYYRESLSSLSPPAVLARLHKINYVQPSKIQSQAIPLLLRIKYSHSLLFFLECCSHKGNHDNMILQSQVFVFISDSLNTQAGTGKTAAFAISILSRVDPSQKKVQVQILLSSSQN
jgi:superfamily II DNA/RNA helicase